jgi:hypothetical protein
LCHPPKIVRTTNEALSSLDPLAAEQFVCKALFLVTMS